MRIGWLLLGDAVVKTAGLKNDGDRLVAAISPIPAMGTVKRRLESTVCGGFISSLPVAGEIVAVIKALTVHVKINGAAF